MPSDHLDVAVVTKAKNYINTVSFSHTNRLFLINFKVNYPFKDFSVWSLVKSSHFNRNQRD